MQIASITPVSHTPSNLNPSLVSMLPSSASTSAALPAVSAKPSPSAVSAPGTQPATQSTAAAPRSATVQAAATQIAATSSLSNVLVAGFSTTVNGTHYASSVDESGGVYTATVPTIPVVAASGSSITAAENNLNLRIDVLV